MNFSNLQAHYEELLSYMEMHQYSATYIDTFRSEIQRILKHADKADWKSYRDIYREYEAVLHSNDYLRNKRTIIGALEQFDLHGFFPDGRRRHSLVDRSSYHFLIPEFKELIDFYMDYELNRGKRESTIYTESHNTASFLVAMQSRGCKSLDSITEEDVLSFFLSASDRQTKSCSYRKNISAVFKAGAHWKENECRKILSFLPMLRQKRKNIQYLTLEEVSVLRKLVTDNSLSMRNAAILALLLYTGLRGCDISGMQLGSIDWEHDVIHICQQKTEEPLELPLSSTVGNIIFDYLQHERPLSNDPHLFLTETKPYPPLKSGSIGNIVSKIMKAANLRLKTGDRKGTHIFRHNLAASLLENGISRPVISQTLGHTAPDSLEPYLRADFIHLKKCAISIDPFPVSEEVFGR